MALQVARVCFGIGVAAWCLASSAQSSPALHASPGVYSITTQTLLPHLAESLRYATTVHQQCLRGDEVAALFPILRHEAFAGCALGAGVARGEQHVHILTCQNPGAATGTATISNTSDLLSGVLDIKMGGKNMTLSQRVQGPRVRACD